MSWETSVRAGVLALTGDRPVTIDEYLRFGAAIGVLGWLATQIAAWYPTAVGASLVGVVGFWIALTALLYVGGFRLPRTRRYSRPLLVWGGLNALATAINVAAVLGVWPDALAAYLGYAFWHPWAVVMGAGYLYTGTVATTRRRGVYIAGGVVAFGFLALGTVAPGAVGGVTYLALGAIHAVPMALDAGR